MPHSDFVHLRVHSAYSLSEGAIKVDKIAALAQAAAMPAVAITDTGNLFGALEFSQYCAAKGVQPIIGCQVAGRRGTAACRPDPLVLLAQDAAGLANLQHLSSLGFLTAIRPILHHAGDALRPCRGADAADRRHARAAGAAARRRAAGGGAAAAGDAGATPSPAGSRWRSTGTGCRSSGRSSPG